MLLPPQWTLPANRHRDTQHFECHHSDLEGCAFGVMLLDRHDALLCLSIQPGRTVPIVDLVPEIDSNESIQSGLTCLTCV
jgi:hypothetical protein